MEPKAPHDATFSGPKIEYPTITGDTNKIGKIVVTSGAMIMGDNNKMDIRENYPHWREDIRQQLCPILTNSDEEERLELIIDLIYRERMDAGNEGARRADSTELGWR